MRRSNFWTPTANRRASSLMVAGEVAKLMGVKLNVVRAPFPSMISPVNEDAFSGVVEATKPDLMNTMKSTCFNRTSAGA
jgi:hypothetical protein